MSVPIDGSTNPLTTGTYTATFPAVFADVPSAYHLIAVSDANGMNSDGSPVDPAVEFAGGIFPATDNTQTPPQTIVYVFTAAGENNDAVTIYSENSDGTETNYIDYGTTDYTVPSTVSAIHVRTEEGAGQTSTVTAKPTFPAGTPTSAQAATLPLWIYGGAGNDVLSNGNLIDQPFPSSVVFGQLVYISSGTGTGTESLKFEVDNKPIDEQVTDKIIAVEKDEGYPSFASAAFSNNITFNGTTNTGNPIVVRKDLNFTNLQTPLLTCPSGWLASRNVTPMNFRIVGGASVSIGFKPNAGNGTSYKWVQCTAAYWITRTGNVVDDSWHIDNKSKGIKGFDYPFQSWQDGVLTLTDTPSFWL